MKRYMSKLHNALKNNNSSRKHKEEVAVRNFTMNDVPPSIGKYKEKNDKRRLLRTNGNLSDQQKKVRLIADGQSENSEYITFRHPNNWKIHHSGKSWKDLVLADVDDHPMLKQELVANIDGSDIQFHLISVEPKLLLQEPVVINTEPIPSLIWPYD